MIPLYPIKFVWDLLGDTSKAANYIQYITISIMYCNCFTVNSLLIELGYNEMTAYIEVSIFP